MVFLKHLPTDTDMASSKKTQTDDVFDGASVLAFERRISPSDAFMFSVSTNAAGEDVILPITVREKSVRGTNSSYNSNPDKLAEANPQTIDIATLPNNASKLMISFNVRFLSNVGVPSACNSEAFADGLNAAIKRYRDRFGGFSVLAKAYATALASGGFLFRNRMDAHNIVITFSETVFDGSEQRVHEVVINGDAGKNAASIEALAEIINRGFESNGGTIVSVKAVLDIGAGQEVFPSQEMIIEKAKGDKSRVLYTLTHYGENGTVTDDVAGIHSQKIGNALRTIDIWYPEYAQRNIPISIEPYGSAPLVGRAFREARSSSFYGLCDEFIKATDGDLEAGKEHFVVACLIRGGVFGKSGKAGKGDAGSNADSENAESGDE